MARPKKEIDRDELRRLAGLGLSYQQMADCLGMSRETLAKRRAEDPTLDAVIDSGRSESIAKVSNALFESALEGNTTAQIFIMKARAGWAETQRVEVTNKPAEECTIDELAERLRGQEGISQAPRRH